MEILFIYPQWGSAHLDLPVFLEKIKKAGYDGVELGLPIDKGERKYIADTVRRFDMALIAQHYHTDTSDFENHLDSFQQYLSFMAEEKPMLINSHTGKDYFSFEENAVLIKKAQSIEEETGVPIAHETHRSRFSFAAHECRKYLNAFPDLKLTTDLSHWTNVAESMLEDQQEAVHTAIDHTHHLHARVGSTQTAQVIDPRDQNYSAELDQFLEWWKLIIESAKARGLKKLTITPEYGPAPYQQNKPYTKTPLADQWEVNEFIREKIRNLI